MRHLKYYRELNEQENKRREEVIKIQSALKEAGFGDLLGNSGPNKDGVDGLFGEQTRNAVRAFQKKNGINPTGRVGKITAPKLGITLSKKEETKKEDPKKKEATKTGEDYLMFSGNFLYWMNPEGKFKKKWPACSGRTQYHLFLNKDVWINRYKMKPQEWAKFRDTGPTPEGEYMMGPLLTREIPNDWLDKDKVTSLLAKQVANSYDSSIKSEEKHEWGDTTLYSRVAWGTARGVVTPMKGTDTFGRSGMYLHGGSLPGSIGCIDLVTGIQDFTEYFMAWSGKTGNKKIRLKVDYKTFNPNISVDVPGQPVKLPEFNMTSSDDFIKKSNSILSDTLKKENVRIPKEMDIQKTFSVASVEDQKPTNSEEALT